MRYNPQPPYEILENKLLDFATIQRLRRFSRYWDMVGNSGNFVETTPLIWSPDASPFSRFLAFADYLFAQVGRTDGIALARLAEFIFKFLTRDLDLPTAQVAETMWRDLQRGGRRDKPEFLREFLPNDGVNRISPKRRVGLKRQARHLTT